jgi:hypothetical protein
MKTPREILLASHQAAEPRLDELRRHVVAGLAAESQRRPSTNRSWLAVLEEFLRLPRPVLGGLATAWLIIIVLNVASRDAAVPASPGPQQMAKTSKDTLQALREQKRLFAELVGTLKDPEAEAPRFVPRPRGELKPQQMTA